MKSMRVYKCYWELKNNDPDSKPSIPSVYSPSLKHTHVHAHTRQHTHTCARSGTHIKECLFTGHLPLMKENQACEFDSVLLRSQRSMYRSNQGQAWGQGQRTQALPC